MGDWTLGGLIQPTVDEERDAALKTKPQLHRAELSFQPEGFGFTMNQDNEAGDYTPLTFETTLDGAVAIDDTVITVDSVWGFSESQELFIDKDEAGEEGPLTILSIDPSAKEITLTSALEAAHDDGVAVSADRIKVNYDSDKKETTVDFYIGGQNADSCCAGGDIQKGQGRGAFADFDNCCCRIVVPVWGGSDFIFVNGPYMCRGQYAINGDKEISIDANEAASAIDPDYVLRIIFKSEETTPTPKKSVINLGTWRA